eukprot:Gb_00435 [translate_table: standard]
MALPVVRFHVVASEWIGFPTLGGLRHFIVALALGRGKRFVLIFDINEEAWPPLHAPPLASNVPLLEWATLLGGGWWSLEEAFEGEEREPFIHAIHSNTFFLAPIFGEAW